MWRIIISLLTAGMLLSLVGSVAAYDPSTIVVSDIPGQSTSTLASVQTDGETVVWVERFLGREKGGRAYMTDLSTLEPVLVTTESVYEIAIDQGVVVWSGSETDSTTGRPINFNIKGMDLERGTHYDYSTPNHDVMPAIAGGLVVWVSTALDPHSGRGPEQILAQYVDDEEPRVINHIEEDWEAEPPKIDDRIVWRESKADGDGVLWRLWMASLGMEPTLIDHGRFGSEDHGRLNVYDTVGDTIVYTGNSGVVALNYVSGEEKILAQDTTTLTYTFPFVFWVDAPDPLDQVNPTIRINAYDLVTDRTFKAVSVHRDPVPSWEHVSEVDARMGVLVWLRSQIGPTDWAVGSAIHAASICDLMPIAPRPDPGTTDRNWLYFDKTGHYLSYGFKNFWQRSGGLPVFGYPLTTEFDELNADLGEMRTVQYLERQRFEYHPAYAGTPYETLLGRLGAEDAWIRGLEDNPAFHPLPSGTRSTGNTDFFAETGHTLAGPFRDYWHGHGVDFGDAGVSYRESLALFGFPISEEYVDPDTGLVTQYFERAVFEYHPDNPDPYKVLLLRLGAERLNMYWW
jgi:hypothetical protein